MFCTESMGDLWHSYEGSTSILPDVYHSLVLADVSPDSRVIYLEK